MPDPETEACAVTLAFRAAPVASIRMLVIVMFDAAGPTGMPLKTRELPDRMPLTEPAPVTANASVAPVAGIRTLLVTARTGENERVISAVALTGATQVIVRLAICSVTPSARMGSGIALILGQDT